MSKVIEILYKDTLILHGGYTLTINFSIPGQNGRLFTDDIFICIFVNERFCILIRISLKFVPKGPIDNNPALFQMMACLVYRIGDKSLSEPMQA